MKVFAMKVLPRAYALLGLAVIILAAHIAALAPAAAQTTGKRMTTPSGLQIIDTVVGTGASPNPCSPPSSKNTTIAPIRFRRSIPFA